MSICLSGCGTKAVRRLLISVLAICYGGGGTQYRPTAFDLPKAKAIAVSLGTPIYNELPISISIAHSFIYINQGPCRLRQRPKALWLKSQNPLSHSLPQPPFPSLSSPSPLADGKPVCRAQAQDPRQRHKPRSDRHTDDQRHGPKRN